MYILLNDSKYNLYPGDISVTQSPALETTGYCNMIDDIVLYFDITANDHFNSS